MIKIDKHKTSSDAELVQTVNNLVREVVLLQKTVNHQSSDNIQTIAMVLLRQKKSLDKLKQMASDGIALAAAGYVKCCCISGHQADHIFRYHDIYRPKTGQMFLDFLFRPENIIPFLCHQKVVQKVNSLAVFVQDLPNLNSFPVRSVLLEALRITDSDGKMFDEQLADKLLLSAQSDEKMEKEMALKIMEQLANKGYAQVQLTYASVLKKDGKANKARQIYQSVLMNKFATTEQMQVAKDILFPVQSAYRGHANQLSHAF